MIELIVTCVKSESEEAVLLLPEQVNTALGDDNYVVLMGYTVDRLITEYRISEGREYRVYGILFHKDQIRYLVQDDDGRPVFCPSPLFRIQQAIVSCDWETEIFTADGKTLGIVGYPAMEGGYEELINLVSRKDAARKRFLKYKDYVQMNGDLPG